MATATMVAEIDIMPDDIQDIRRSLDMILARLSDLERRVVTLATLQEKETLLCPYRGTVERNTGRLDRMEDAVLNIRLEMARTSLVSGSAGGGVVVVIGGILLAVGKAMHWI